MQVDTGLAIVAIQILLAAAAIVTREIGLCARQVMHKRRMSGGPGHVSAKLPSLGGVQSRLLRGTSEGVTRNSLVTSAVLGLFVVELVGALGLLPAWWRWWEGPIIILALVAVGGAGLHVVSTWWNHSRFLGRFVAYIAFVAILLLCTCGLWFA